MSRTESVHALTAVCAVRTTDRTVRDAHVRFPRRTPVEPHASWRDPSTGRIEQLASPPVHIAKPCRYSYWGTERQNVYEAFIVCVPASSSCTPQPSSPVLPAPVSPSPRVQPLAPPMAAQFAPLTVNKLRDELLTHPLMLSIGSLSLSTFMSRSIYGMIDWRPVCAPRCARGRLTYPPR